MSSLVVLMYHAIENHTQPSGSTDLDEIDYILNSDDFEQQMAYLHANNYQTVLLSDLQSGKDIAERSLVITFDDGHKSNCSLALPILARYNFCAEFYVTTDWIATDNFMSEEQIMTLFQSGMAIGSHGMSHRFLSDLPNNEVKTELKQSKRRLEEIISEPVHTFAAPGGRINKSVLNIVRDVGYSMSCSSEANIYNSDKSSHMIPRFAIKRNTSMQEFKLIVEQDSAYLRKVIFRVKLLGIAKQLLGNTLYKRLRETLIRLER